MHQEKATETYVESCQRRRDYPYRKENCGRLRARECMESAYKDCLVSSACFGGASVLVALQSGIYKSMLNRQPSERRTDFFKRIERQLSRIRD